MRGHYKVTTAPASEPVTLAEARKQLNFTADDPTDDDTYIEALIGVARHYCEEYTNRAFMPQTITHVLPCFPVPDPYRNPYAAIRLFRSPFISLTSVTYIDTDDAETPVLLDVSGSDADVIVVGTAEPATVSPWIKNMPDGWPDTNTERPDAVTLVYQAGYANAAAVPKVFKQAILLIVADMYENRQDRVKQLPTAAENLLNLGGVVREY